MHAISPSQPIGPETRMVPLQLAAQRHTERPSWSHNNRPSAFCTLAATVAADVPNGGQPTRRGNGCCRSRSTPSHCRGESHVPRAAQPNSIFWELSPAQLAGSPHPVSTIPVRACPKLPRCAPHTWPAISVGCQPAHRRRSQGPRQLQQLCNEPQPRPR